MDEFRRLMTIQSIQEDRARDAQADLHRHSLLGGPRPGSVNLSHLGLVVTLIGIGLFLVWGH